MAIKVEHGGKGSDTAGQIIAQAGQGELDRRQNTLQGLLRLAGSARPGPLGGGGGGGGPAYDEKAMAIRKLNAARAMKTEEIEGQAARQQQAADYATAQTALKFGLDEQIREQEFENTLKAKQEEARLAANQWELSFSPKQIQEIARRNNSNDLIAADDSLSPEMKAEMTAANNSYIDNMQPHRKPADPNRWKGDPSQGPGMSWIAKDGSKMYRTSDNEERLILKPSETAEGIAKAAKAKSEAAAQERAQALEDKHADRAAAHEDHLWGLTIEVSDGVDDNNVPLTKSVPIDAAGVQERMEAWHQRNLSPAQREQAAIQAQEDAKREAEFEARIAKLPVGAEYIAPNGNVMRKKRPERVFPPNPFAAGRLTK